MKKILWQWTLVIGLLASSCNDRPTPPVNGQPPASEAPMAKEKDTDFIGMPLKKAESLAKARGLKHRVTKVDGEYRPATMDYRPDRVSFEVEKGKVVGVSRG